MKNLFVESENNISLFEDANDIIIPTTIKSFLLKYGTGRTNAKFYLPDDVVTISSILSYSINDEMQKMFDFVNGLFPSKKWLPFGLDPGDWIFCISLNIETFGAVYLMRVDEELESEAFLLISNSFDEFIKGSELKILNELLK